MEGHCNNSEDDCSASSFMEGSSTCDSPLSSEKAMSPESLEKTTPEGFSDQVVVKSAGDAGKGRRKKQPHPRRSLPADDPNFKGANVYMRVVTENMESKLLMNVTFHGVPEEKPRFRRNKNLVPRSHSSSESGSSNPLDNGGDEDEDLQPTNVPYEKHCASCKAKKTPLWRDAEDGTPLCNACGIRYKKYKIRCARCWHIPKKDEFSPNCISCGSGFQFAPPKTW